MPKITVLLPTFQSGKYIRKSLDSVFNQTYQDFDILVIDDGSTDDTITIIESYCDPRIQIVCGPKKGLAAALNYGISLSKGEYIARLDSDDYSVKTRFQKQVEYLDNNQDVMVCGSWQVHFGTSNFIHKPPCDKNQCKTNLIFFCDMCHSTVMMRKKFFIDNDLYYSNEYYAEDFQLWTKVIELGNISNIPKILGFYRHAEDNITTGKVNDLMYDESKIMSETIHRMLGIDLTDRQKKYFVGYTNPFFDSYHFPDITDSLKESYNELEDVLKTIYLKNKEIRVFDDQSLLRSLEAEWNHLRYNLPFQILSNPKSIDKIFDEMDVIEKLKIHLIHFFNTNYGFSNKMKVVIRYILDKVIKRIIATLRD